MPSAKPPQQEDKSAQSCEDLLQQARFFLAAERPLAAAALAQLAEQRSSASGDSGGAAVAAQLQAEAHWACESHDQTYRCAMRAAEFFAQSGQDEASVVAQVAMLNLAVLAACATGLAQDALPLALRALELASRTGPPDCLASALSSFAHVQAHLGDFDAAEQVHQQALSKAQESGNGLAMVRCFATALMAGVLAFDHMLSGGKTLLAQASSMRWLPLAEQASSLLDMGGMGGLLGAMSDTQRVILRLNVGHVLMNAERFEEAGRLFRDSLEQVSESSSELLHYAAAHALCELDLRRGQLASAQERLQQLLARRSVSLNPLQREDFLRTAMNLCQAMKEQEQSFKYGLRLSQVLAEQAHKRQQAALQIRAALQGGSGISAS